MLKKTSQIYQFKIMLEGIKPAIWRRIQVPETYTFWDLHVAIQDSMGWLDYHLHQFKITNSRTNEKDIIGIPDDEWEDAVPTLSGWEIPISSYFSLQTKNADYEYDFGDGWQHKITLEAILSLDPNHKYPTCIAGENACPPEDCGGIWGYENLLKVIKSPNHEEYESMMQWLGDNFNPTEFNPTSVYFDNPHERWKTAFLKPNKVH